MTWARVLGAVVLCTAVAALFGTLRERDAGPGALLQHRGDYDGGGKMAKGLGVQAHDLGWDGGNAAGAHGITYSQLPVQRGGEISVYRRDFDADMRRWFPASSARALPPPPPPPAEAVVRPQERNVYAQTGGILPAINTGLQVAWDNLAMTSSAHGCDAACLKDIYRRAFRSHATPPQQREAPAPPPTYSAEQRDKDLFGQAPAATDVSPSTFSEAYQDVTSVGVPAAPAMLGALSRYLPQVVSAEQQLARAIAQRKHGRDSWDAYKRRHMRRRKADEEHRSQFQYKLKLTDEYDAKSQQPLRRFVKDVTQDETPDDDGVVKTRPSEVEQPVLMCGEGSEKTAGTWGKLDRLDDCDFGEGDATRKYYNRMFYLDREKARQRASPRLIHRHMQGVERLVDKWKPLLVGAGGGTGEPGAFDDPYYFCYDQYQEDPEFSSCLRDLAVSKSGALRKWARPALTGTEDGDQPSSHAGGYHGGIRPGFPDLRLGSKDYWRKGFRRRGWARGWVAQLRKDPTGGRGDDESSKAPEWIEPEGGADWFQEKK